MIKIGIQIALFFLPWGLRRILLAKIFSFEIEPTSKIGYSILLCDNLKLMKGAKIGSLTFVRGLRLLSIDSFGSLGNLNWISGFPIDNNAHFSHQIGRDPILKIGTHSAITNRHLIDCTDKVIIGNFSTFAGFRSQILTHSIDLRSNRQSCEPVNIGDYCFIGTGCTILGGSSLPDRSVLGAMSLLNSNFYDGGYLYGGVPARRIRPIDADDKYFSRKQGFVN